MPKVQRYLERFGLKIGSYLSGYYLANITTQHISIKRYREYEYPTVMVWRVYDNTANYQNLIQNLVSHLQENRVIYTSYGNPYRCDFGQLKVTNVTSNEVTIEARGKCDRIFT